MNQVLVREFEDWQVQLVSTRGVCSKRTSGGTPITARILP